MSAAAAITASPSAAVAAARDGHLINNSFPSSPFVLFVLSSDFVSSSMIPRAASYFSFLQLLDKQELLDKSNTFRLLLLIILLLLLILLSTITILIKVTELSWVLCLFFLRQTVGC